MDCHLQGEGILVLVHLKHGHGGRTTQQLLLQRPHHKLALTVEGVDTIFVIKGVGIHHRPVEARHTLECSSECSTTAHL